MAEDESTTPGASEDTDTSSTTDADTGAQDGGGSTDTGNTSDTEKTSTGSDDSKAAIARLEKQLADARAEAGKERVNAKKQAADDAVNELTAKLGKALGLIKDGDDAPDPKVLADQLAAKDTEARATRVELAVYRNAGKHGADPDALTDSRTFLDKVSKLDPTADDFNSKVAEAIKKAVADNPRLKAAGQAPATSGGEITGGSGERQQKPNSVDAHRAALRKEKTGRAL